jgi:hypothetical protein
MTIIIPDIGSNKKIYARSKRAPVLNRVRGKLLLFVLMVMGTVFHPGPAWSAEPGGIDLEIRDQSLEKALGQVSQISGYTIYLQPMWRDEKVTVTLVNLSLEQAIIKILDNSINYAIIWNDTEKKISIIGAKTVQENNPVIIPHPKGISGQGIRFEQGSRTTEY